MIDFAILAPIPFYHLDSGHNVVQERNYVSFGSSDAKLFREVDQMRNGAKVPVLIYASHRKNRSLPYQITWIGCYIGHVTQLDEKRQDEKEGHRPASTSGTKGDDADGWPVFWRVEDLQRLLPDKQKPITDIPAYKTGPRLKDKPPRGPRIVARPDWVDCVLSSLIPLPAVDVADPPQRIKTTINRIVRDTAKAQQLKQLYDFRCQVCGERLKIGADEYYAEVHHIRPLGGEHSGVDAFSNMLVVCPNHHALFDYGIPKFISIDEVEIDGKQSKLISHHKISDENVNHHNNLRNQRKTALP